MVKSRTKFAVAAAEYKILGRGSVKRDSELHMRSHNETNSAHRVVVMLGASNLSRAFPIAITTSRQMFESPVRFYVAKGHGRSYGQVSSCFGKKISGIFSCGIWSAIECEKSMPITAFMTDIGNDLAYEVPVDTVATWVEGCLDRLLTLNARVVISDLPIDALRQVSDLRYRLLRTLLFPRCRLSWPEILGRAEQLSERVQKIAESRQVPMFSVRKQWYGLDPIHPRKRCYPKMWADLWSLAERRDCDVAESRCPIGLNWYLRRLVPERWSVLSISRRANQPNGRLKDGTSIALY